MSTPATRASMPMSSRAMSTTPRFQPPSPEMKRATWDGRGGWRETGTLPKGSSSNVSSVAAAGRATEARRRRLAANVFFIGGSLCTNPAPGQSPILAMEDPVGDRPVILARDVPPRPRQPMGHVLGDLEAEAVLLPDAVGAEDLLAAELLELRQHRQAVLGGLAEPLRGMEAEVGGAGGAHQDDQRDLRREIGGQPVGQEGHDVRPERIADQDHPLLVPEGEIDAQDPFEVRGRGVGGLAAEEVAQRVPPHAGNPPLASASESPLS